ncbi:MAG: hypothetical protein ACOYN6_14970 [Ignavibacteria bacterium]
MRKQKAIIDFSKVKDNDLTEVAQVIWTKLTGNPDFTTPIPPLSSLKSAIDDYSGALITSKDGTKQDTAIKNANRAALLEILTDLGNYVNMTADGDLVRLEGSGYPLTKVPSPIGILEQPATFKVLDGIDPGSVKIENSVVAKATGYIVLFYQIKDGVAPPLNDSEWQKCLFSKTTGLITGLKSGCKYMFKSAATSPEANKITLYNFTEPIERFVQ